MAFALLTLIALFVFSTLLVVWRKARPPVVAVTVSLAFALACVTSLQIGEDDAITASSKATEALRSEVRAYIESGRYRSSNQVSRNYVTTVATSSAVHVTGSKGQSSVSVLAEGAAITDVSCFRMKEHCPSRQELNDIVTQLVRENLTRSPNFKR